jgi:ATP-dependent DNA ligase
MGASMIVQKAKHLYSELEKKKPSCISVLYAIFEKYDGWYGYIDLDGTDNAWITSRADRAIPSTVDISKRLRQAAPKGAVGRLIFEITIPSIPDFSTLNGVLNRSKAPCQAAGVVLKCHDFIDARNRPFTRRYEHVKAIVSDINLDWVQVAPIIGTGSYKDVQAAAEQVWEQGGEGAIGKAINEPYHEGKRDWSLIKVKEDVDADLLVCGMVIGNGKYANTLGALVCRDKANNKHTISGMTDEQRYQWWSNPEAIMGKVVEIKAMKKLKDGQYREPRFKAVRFDKTVADID